MFPCLYRKYILEQRSSVRRESGWEETREEQRGNEDVRETRSVTFFDPEMVFTSSW